jgi:hypothetical protein
MRCCSLNFATHLDIADIFAADMVPQLDLVAATVGRKNQAKNLAPFAVRFAYIPVALIQVDTVYPALFQQAALAEQDQNPTVAYSLPVGVATHSHAEFHG